MILYLLFQFIINCSEIKHWEIWSHLKQVTRFLKNIWDVVIWICWFALALAFAALSHVCIVHVILMSASIVILVSLFHLHCFFMQIHVQIKFPEPTKLGLEFLEVERDKPFYVYPEADMLLSMNKCKSYSTFADWGKGWADPEIRRQRLEKRRLDRKPRKPRRKRKSRKRKPDMTTARGRITAKLSKLRWSHYILVSFL